MSPPKRTGPSTRVRDDEFTAVGTVADLHRAIDAWLEQLAKRKDRLATATELADTPKTQVPLDGEWTVGAAYINRWLEWTLPRCGVSRRRMNAALPCFT